MSELESLLLAQDDLIECFCKIELVFMQANLAQGGVQDENNIMQAGNGIGQGGRKGRRRGFRGGCSWSNGNRPQCQLCGKLGYTMWQCYHRFDQDFPNPQRTIINPLPPPPISFHNPTSISIQNQKAYLATPIALIDVVWSLDSRASYHITFDQRNMIAGLEYEGFE